MRNVAGWALTAVAVVTMCCLSGLAVIGGSGAQASCYSGVSAPDVPPWIGGDHDLEQVTNATIIVQTGQKMSVPARGWVIAVATALQESGLRNIDYGDRDSIGLFQQRPSQGWGTVEQIRDPVYASTKFYEKLLTVDGWQAMPLTQAAQAVQKSAFPDAYAKHEAAARDIVSAVSGVPVEELIGCATGPWTQPVHASVWSGFRTPERPTHQGVDLAAGRGMVIVAASAGIVVRVRCDIEPASWGCDQDGTPTTPGCGWYVDISHAEGFITRYCHMARQPDVSVGDHVVAGQPIGIVGSSGHSSAPHLHFEVHINNDASGRGAIDPVAFMAERLAPIGRPGS